jgi:hypothetical protein
MATRRVSNFRLRAALFFAASWMAMNGSSAFAQCTNVDANTRVCRVERPPVHQSSTTLNNIRLSQGDRISIAAGGCVQTGGVGKTWKRYVNPSGPNTDRLYHGLISIPGATAGLVRLQSVVGTPLRVQISGAVAENSPLVVGYEDDNFHDNGYDRHDDGTEGQCKNEGPAFLELRIVSDPWSDWTEIPGGGRSANALAAEFFYGRLFAFHTGLDQNIYGGTFDGQSWSPWSQIPGGGKTVLPLAATRGLPGLFLFHVGLDRRVYFSVARDNSLSSFDGWREVPGGFQTDSAVAAASADYETLVFARDANNAIWSNRFAVDRLSDQSGTWHGWEQVPSGVQTTLPPAAASQSPNLSLFALDTRWDVRMLERSGGAVRPDGTVAPGTWGSWTTLPRYLPIRVRGVPVPLGATADSINSVAGPSLLALELPGNTWSPVSSEHRTSSALTGASFLRSGSSGLYGQAKMYLLSRSLDNRLFYVTRAPVRPFPPPPKVTVTLTANKTYVNPGDAATISWSVTANDTCVGPDEVLTSQVYGQTPRALLVSNGDSPRRSTDVKPFEATLTTYVVTATCRGSAVSAASNAVGVTLAPPPAVPAASLAYVGPFTEPGFVVQKMAFKVRFWFVNAGTKSSTELSDVRLVIDGKNIGDSKSIGELAPKASTELVWEATALEGFSHTLDLFVGSSDVYHGNLPAYTR